MTKRSKRVHIVPLSIVVALVAMIGLYPVNAMAAQTPAQQPDTTQTQQKNRQVGNCIVNEQHFLPVLEADLSIQDEDEKEWLWIQPDSSCHTLSQHEQQQEHQHLSPCLQRQVKELVGGLISQPSPLCVAVWSGSSQSVKQQLLKSPKQLHDICTTTGANVMQVAAMLAYPKIVQLLLRAGADQDKSGRLQLPPLLMAAGSPFSAAHQVVLHLLEADADTNKTLPNGWTALHMAAASPSPFAHQNLQVLLQAGMDKNATDHQGQTPLMVCVQQGHWKNTQTLLESEAKTDIQDKSGNTALDWAKLLETQKCIELLQEHERKS